MTNTFLLLMPVCSYAHVLYVSDDLERADQDFILGFLEFVVVDDVGSGGS